MIKIKNNEQVEPYEFDFDNFVNKNFNSMILHRALLQGHNLSGSSFVKTILRGAELDGADFSNANMAECSLAVVFGENSNFSAAKITNAILAGARFSFANFKDADLSNSYISATFNYSNLEGTKWIKADLALSKFENANLKYANFSEANVGGTQNNIGGDLVRGSTFKGANLCGADFSTCININEAHFDGALYNSKTKWPRGFDPKQKGAIEELN